MGKYFTINELTKSSGYRGKALNKAVGGAASSQHCLGMAADIHTVSNTKESNKKLFELIKKYYKSFGYYY